MSGNDRAAVVVAGGYSRRFGNGEKALAVVDGIPLLRHVVECAAPHVDELVVNCRRDQCPDFAAVLAEPELAIESSFVHDPVPDTGPVAGMTAGFRETDASHVLALSCDLPFLEDDVIETLFETTEITGRTAVPVAEGYPQPLCAVYQRRPALAACRATHYDNDDRVYGVVERLNPVWIDIDRRQSFRDIDTQEDLSWARDAAD